MKFSSIVLVWILSFFSIASYCAETGEKPENLILIPQDVYKSRCDDSFDKGYTALLHSELKKQLEIKGFQVVKKSRRDIMEQGPEDTFVLEARTLGGGLSAKKESIRVRLSFFKIIRKHDGIDAHNFDDYDVDFKGIKYQWKTENIFEIELKISGKNEQKVKEQIPNKIKKTLKKHFE